MTVKETARQQIAALVEKFDADYKRYTAPSYNETEVRIQFINPFFEALGWDIADSKGLHEVFHEDYVEVDEAGKKRGKRPDYGFRLNNQTRFFVEAKKPSVNLKDDLTPAFQVRRYGWSARLPVSVLTDFEEFIVYDCRVQPAQDDKPTIGRLRYYTYTEYVEKWDEIYDLFSYEAVQANRLETWVQETKQRGTVTVDDAFLNEMEIWRKSLAEDIALHNRGLTRRQLNMAVQTTIDRIVFLRICEDRGIEPPDRLQAFGRGTQVYSNLISLFKQADQRYNSGLFHFDAEKGREEPDTITPSLTISDDTLQHIISRLYYPSPYAFSVIPADILGQIYERFLGKVIELTPGGGAKVEEKPEVRKAGGVFYTPTYIVDYIVQNTVGKLIEGKTPEQVAKLRILDPACGSGSFLIGAYQFLLDWHLAYYTANEPSRHLKTNPKRLREVILTAPTGETVSTAVTYALTTDMKKQILLNNIYGVDLDQQAVEVTKLSLLLKVLEGETAATAQPELFAERVLPDLGDNIKWGNSLIGPDYYSGKQIPMFDEEELNRVKTFDWQSKSEGFGAITSAGGFDAVIGNPPWVFTKYVDWGEETKLYIQDKYLSDREEDGRSKSRQAGKINLFAMFILKGINLLKNNGLFGFIIPNNILRTTVYDITRKNIMKLSKIKTIVDLKAGIFTGVTASTIILIIEAGKPTSNHTIQVIENIGIGSLVEVNSGEISQVDCLANPSYVIDLYSTLSVKSLIEKLHNKSVSLGSLIDVLNGIATHKDMAGILDKAIDSYSKPILFGKDISRFTYTYSGKYVNYDRNKLLRARDESIFLADEKLIMQRIGGILITAYDDQKYYTFNSVNNLLLKSSSKYNIKYILGILNSILLRSYYIARFTNNSALTVNISKTFLDTLPIRTINMDIPDDKEDHDRMVQLVKTMLDLHKQLATAPNPQVAKTIQSVIDKTDRDINQLVYKLYDLTPEEIALVEGQA